MKNFVTAFIALIAVVMITACNTDEVQVTTPVPTDDSYVVATNDYMMDGVNFKIDKIQYCNLKSFRVENDPTGNPKMFVVTNGNLDNVIPMENCQEVAVHWDKIKIEGNYVYANGTWYRIPDKGLNEGIGKYVRKLYVSKGYVVSTYSCPSGFSCICFILAVIGAVVSFATTLLTEDRTKRMSVYTFTIITLVLGVIFAGF